MIQYKATGEYSHYGEVYLINGKGYALHWEIDNSAPCGRCALFNNITTDPEKCVCILIRKIDYANMILEQLKDGILVNMYIYRKDVLL